MNEAVIVSVARTPIGKAYRGVFNDTEAPALGGHVVRAAVERAQLDLADIDDVLRGCAAQQGTLNEAFACQVDHRREQFGISADRLNVDGGAISVSHPFGMSGTGTAMHSLLEALWRGVRYVIVTVCIGMGVTALFETVA